MRKIMKVEAEISKLNIVEGYIYYKSYQKESKFKKKLRKSDLKIVKFK